VPIGEEIAPALTVKIAELGEKAYLFTRILTLLPKNEKAFLLRDYYDNQFKRSLTVILRLSAVRAPSTPIETCIQIIQVREPRRLPFVLELLDGLLNPSERRLIYPLIEAASITDRDHAGAEHFASLPTSLEPLLLANIDGSQSWIATISVDYISGSSKTLEASPKMYTTLEKAVFLKSVSLFQNIPAERIADIAQVAVETRVPANTVLFREGDRGDSLYIVLDGCVLVHKEGRKLASLTQGSCVGEMAVLDHEPRSADATVMEDSTLLRIDQEAFYEVLSQNQELMHGIIRLLTSRLRTAGERLAAISSKSDAGLAPVPGKQ
jgi:CRP/FNR family cyclic AMP-dependent transcriptional regulator